MQQTETYNLKLIETSDPFSPDALNENARKVDALLRGQLMFSTGEYTGDGQVGKEYPKRLEFDFKPLIVWVFNATTGAFGHFAWLRGTIQGCTYQYNAAPSTVNLTWEDRAVQWYYNGTSSRTQLTENGTRYVYMAIGVLD